MLDAGIALARIDMLGIREQIAQHAANALARCVIVGKYVYLFIACLLAQLLKRAEPGVPNVQ
ncbi:ABC-type arginine/histidine transport system permease subunit [Paenibacillus harenae]|nr:ABC-type arginine/histidine transport system permease subunit [Paenibacillus harenae]